MSTGSTEKIPRNSQTTMDGSTCLELALEGERLCKAGDCRAGVAFFEAAIQAGTDDLRTLSAIYSQLGNAYFYLGDYLKAMQYHKHDLTLARTMGDKLGEAKASGNLGNTLKVMGKFDEAMICCKRHLEISRELNDKVGEGRALYNLGNVYHAKGKHIGRLGQQDPGEFPEEVRSCLEQAVFYYEENLKLMKELSDTAAQGRACGNLGNTHYLLGNFSQSISFHEERLKIAREFGDKAAERRAHSNLGNAHIFLGEFETAADHYKRTLVLAQELGDRAVEAQACYSLGNTYTLLRDYPTAIDYHLRHLRIAQELLDKVGEGRACWSLGNAHSAMGNHEKALYFANRHLEISKEIGDQMGQATAQMNIVDLRKVLGLPLSGNTSPDSETVPLKNSSPGERRNRLTPDGKQKNSASATSSSTQTPSVTDSPSIGASGDSSRRDKITGSSHLDDEESFFDLVSRFQSKRMDDQRCSLNILENKENNHDIIPNASSHFTNNSNTESEKLNAVMNNASMKPAVLNTGESTSLQDDLLDLIAGMQSKRMDEQRVALPHLPGLHPPVHTQMLQRLSAAGMKDAAMPDDTFFEMLMRCQGTRLEDQRSSLPPNGEPQLPVPNRGPTVPDEDFFSLILRLQSGRMEDQRASVPLNFQNPPVEKRSNSTKNGKKDKKK